jgi:Protein of unknown function (DUF4038)/Domain of unknown function (DUF5060)
VDLSRRHLLLALGAAAPAFGQTRIGTARRIVELTFRSDKSYDDPFNEVTLDVVIAGPDRQERRVPAYWAGEQTWRARITAEEPGEYSFRTECNDSGNAGLHAVTGAVLFQPYAGSNSLLSRGAVQVSASKRHLQYADGSPFFWFGDTWWLGLTKRLRWPEDYQRLTEDRVRKGFNVVQIVAGLYPDMASFDPRGENEAGFPWEKDYRRIRPSYFDQADLRIQHLVDSGIVPCILGCWGYYLPILGIEKMKQHWRYVIARWGALPVVWCLAGEGSMPWYLSNSKPQDRAELEEGWTEMARYVRATDPYNRLITMHPSREGRDVVRDPAVLDFEMLQTGHGDYRSLPNTVRTVVNAYDRQPLMPVINAEVCYEGILERCREDIQRQMFWASILNGACGFTYGANGIWQVNLPDKPFGPSPSGRTWGNTPWQEAAALPGGRQLGLGAEFLRTLPWTKIEPHPEWVSPRWTEKDYDRPYAAGIPGEFRLVYVPSMGDMIKMTHLEAGSTYAITLFNPGTGEAQAFGHAKGDANGEYTLPNFPVVRDWLLVLRRA